LKLQKTCLYNFKPITKMFHAFDNSAPNQPIARKDWMALLARAPLALLEAGLAGHLDVPTQWLRAPQTGLMMVQGRAGATGERFNLGEVTVTRCTLRLVTYDDSVAQVGTAYILGRSHGQVRLAALADALLQHPSHYAALEQSLLLPVIAHVRSLSAARQARADSTKVEFFTVARESGADSGEDS
jgi:alpha-D-ribose 1-methylphosphonate 5-triphosphate synthase subunit PhnG